MFLVVVCGDMDLGAVMEVPIGHYGRLRLTSRERSEFTEDDVVALKGELNTILGFVEQLGEVDVAGVEPMTSVMPMAMKKRADAVTDGNKADDIVGNAPATEDHYFQVPKVVE